MINNLGTQYLTSDHLGSPPVATNGSGAVTRRNDYYPLGEGIPPSWGGGRNVYLGWHELSLPACTDDLRDQAKTYQRPTNQTPFHYIAENLRSISITSPL